MRPGPDGVRHARRGRLRAEAREGLPAAAGGLRRRAGERAGAVAEVRDLQKLRKLPFRGTFPGFQGRRNYGLLLNLGGTMLYAFGPVARPDEPVKRFPVTLGFYARRDALFVGR